MSSNPASPVLSEEKFHKSLELLYDYTKFHIGVYLTFTSAYLTAASANLAGQRLFHVNSCFVWPALIALIVAGMAGGVIVSSITQTSGGDSQTFLESNIGPWDIKDIHFKARYWTYIEHTSFWIGLIFVSFSFLTGNS